MNLPQRIQALAELGKYILTDNEEWKEACIKAGLENPWFTPGFISLAASNIARCFLQKDTLEKWTSRYPIANTETRPRQVGIVMAGNIPLAGFHDFLSVFIAGHKAVIKPSAKDEALIKHLVKKMIAIDSETANRVKFEEMLKGCDAYIATGSNNSSRYFEYYFGKYPHIIRKNRTSVAILKGDETAEELDLLADDIHLYFGMGCRNVTQLYVPQGYDFVPLLNACKKYGYLASHHKYKNNYDYNLAMHILNNKFYMTNGSLLLVENDSAFAPISQVHFRYYITEKDITLKDDEVQCVIGHDHTPFGQAQCPAINDYADGIDTLKFLCSLEASDWEIKAVNL